MKLKLELVFDLGLFVVVLCLFVFVMYFVVISCLFLVDLGLFVVIFQKSKRGSNRGFAPASDPNGPLGLCPLGLFSNWLRNVAISQQGKQKTSDLFMHLQNTPTPNKNIYLMTSFI